MLYFPRLAGQAEASGILAAKDAERLGELAARGQAYDRRGHVSRNFCHLADFIGSGGLQASFVKTPKSAPCVVALARCP